MRSLKVLLLMLVAGAAVTADWQAVQHLQMDQKVEITARNGTRTKAAFVSETAGAIVIRQGSSEQSITKADIRRVRVADAKRKLRNGLIWTALGAGAGAALGAAVCPHCANEGAGAKYTAPAAAIGAALGALKFLSVPYRTIYQSTASD